MRWTPPANLQYEVQLAMKKCPNSPVPHVSVSCKGQACDTILMPCDTNTECGTGMKCSTFKQSVSGTVSDVGNPTDVARLFYDLSLTLSPTAPSCASPAALIGPLYSFMRKYYDGGSVTAKSEIKVCVPAPVPTETPNPAGEQIESMLGISGCASTKILRCKQPRVCGSVWNGTAYESTFCDDCRNVTTKVDCVSTQAPLIAAWNGQLSDGTDALASARFPPLTVRTPAALSTGASVLFYSDCKQNLWLLPSSPVLPVYLNFWGLAPAYKELWGLVKTATDCAAPVSDQAFRVGKGVALDNILYYMTSPQPAAINWGSHKPWTLGGSNTGRLKMPATCTYDHWNSNGWCGLQYTGLSNLFAADIKINARARKCVGGPAGPFSQPEIFVECAGAGCSLLSGIKSCTADVDCSGGLKCQDLNGLWTGLNLTEDFFSEAYWPKQYQNSIYVNGSWIGGGSIPNPAAGTCRNVNLMYDDLRRFLLAGTGNAFTASSKVCMHDVAHFNSIASTWGNGEVTANAGISEMVNLKAWDAPQTNILSYTPVPSVVLTVTLSGSVAPTPTQISAIAARIAALFNIDASLVQVTVQATKKRATYTMVANIFAPQAQSQATTASSSGTLTASLNTAITEATSSSLAVTTATSTIPPTPAATDDGNGSKPVVVTGAPQATSSAASLFVSFAAAILAAALVIIM